MTDFLTSLVDRALDRTPVLQRRQPTLFEPVAEAVFSEQSKPENTLEEQEIVLENRPSNKQKSSVSNSSRLPQLSSQREEPEPQPAETRPARRRQVQESPQPQKDLDKADLESVSFASVREPTRAIRPEEPSRELKPTVVAKPQETTIVSPRAIETIVERRVEREIIKEHATQTPGLEETHSVVQPIGQPKPARDNESKPPKKPLQAEVKKLTPSKEETTIKPLIQKKPVPHRDLPPTVRAVSRAESRQPLKQPMPPAIHVTIGRVEVRATPPAAARPRVAQPVGPKMSLEDYLRSRREGN